MPITQQRMLDLLSSCEDHRQALTNAITLAKTEAQRALDGLCESKDACFNIILLLEENALLRDPVRSATTLALERQHFSKARVKFNTREAERARRRRLPDTNQITPDKET